MHEQHYVSLTNFTYFNHVLKILSYLVVKLKCLMKYLKSRAYSNGAVQPILCSPKYVLWTFTQINNRSYSLICCICSGGRWELATCLSYKREGCNVSANIVAGLQRLTQFPGIQAQRKPVTHLSIYLVSVVQRPMQDFGCLALRRPVLPVVDCWSSDSDETSASKEDKFIRKFWLKNFF